MYNLKRKCGRRNERTRDGASFVVVGGWLWSEACLLPPIDAKERREESYEARKEPPTALWCFKPNELAPRSGLDRWNRTRASG